MSVSHDASSRQRLDLMGCRKNCHHLGATATRPLSRVSQLEASTFVAVGAWRDRLPSRVGSTCTLIYLSVQRLECIPPGGIVCLFTSNCSTRLFGSQRRHVNRSMKFKPCRGIVRWPPSPALSLAGNRPPTLESFFHQNGVFTQRAAPFPLIYRLR